MCRLGGPDRPNPLRLTGLRATGVTIANAFRGPVSAIGMDVTLSVTRIPIAVQASTGSEVPTRWEAYASEVFALRTRSLGAEARNQVRGAAVSGRRLR